MIGTRLSRYPYGPKRQRSHAQRRAGSAWIRAQSSAARAWLAEQPKLPEGWSMRGGRLNPPMDWVWENGKLREPSPEEIAVSERVRINKEIIRGQRVPFTRKKRHRLNHEVSLFARAWVCNGEDSAEWQAIAGWLGDPENLRAANGKLSKFSYQRRCHDGEFQFSQQSVAFAFFLAFAQPSQAAEPVHPMIN